MTDTQEVCDDSANSLIWVGCPTISPRSIYEEKPIIELAIKLAN